MNMMWPYFSTLTIIMWVLFGHGGSCSQLQIRQSYLIISCCNGWHPRLWALSIRIGVAAKCLQHDLHYSSWFHWCNCIKKTRIQACLLRLALSWLCSVSLRGVASPSCVRKDAVMRTTFNWISTALGRRVDGATRAFDITCGQFIRAAATADWNPILHSVSTFRPGNRGWKVQRFVQHARAAPSKTVHLNAPRCTAGLPKFILQPKWRHRIRHHTVFVFVFFNGMYFFFSEVWK